LRQRDGAGAVDTDMVRNNPPEFVDILARSTLLGRVADPDEMVGTALLLTSDAGSYLTGQVIGVDGGLVPR
jgi:NAD(P)-dependent dehydrogenase (short-subunit alcohol dehydrogenase family)